MQEAFGIVIVVVTILAAIIAVVALVMAPKAYEQIGKGGLSLRDEKAPMRGEASETAPAVREDEIRQMLTARNERRARRGGEQVDVEAELARLTKQVDPSLRDEVRQMVVARNARRARKGQEPLDVETEVDRQLRELSG